MGLFSKTVCNICGASVSVGARPILDGYICGKCRSKCSSHLDHLNNMSADEVREHLKYRAQNLTNLKQFHPSKVLLSENFDGGGFSGGPIYIDEVKKQFFVAEYENYLAHNVDVFDYSDFRKFSYSPIEDFITIVLTVYSKPCSTMVEFELAWESELPSQYKRKPQEAPEFKEALAKVQEAEKIFNSFAEYASLPESYNTVNIQCPNCGAMTQISGKTDNCKYCGATIANTFYK